MHADCDLPDNIDQLKQLVLASRAEVEHLKLVIAKLKRLLDQATPREYRGTL